MGFLNRDGLARLAAAAIIAAAATTAWLVIAPSEARGQAADVTVRGCVERDAAASTPIYKLVTPAPAHEDLPSERAEGDRHRRARGAHRGHHGHGICRRRLVAHRVANRS